MASTLLVLTIAVPWVGALLVWLSGDARPRWQHTIAVAAALLAGAASVALLAYSSSQILINIPMGGAFGNFTFAADGLGVFLAVVATVVGSLAVIFSVD